MPEPWGRGGSPARWSAPLRRCRGRAPGIASPAPTLIAAGHPSAQCYHPAPPSYRFVPLRDLLFRPGRGRVDGRAFGFHPHQRMQLALPLVRYALHVMAAGGQRADAGWPIMDEVKGAPAAGPSCGSDGRRADDRTTGSLTSNACARRECTSPSRRREPCSRRTASRATSPRSAPSSATPRPSRVKSPPSGLRATRRRGCSRPFCASGSSDTPISSSSWSPVPEDLARNRGAGGGDRRPDSAAQGAADARGDRPADAGGPARECSWRPARRRGTATASGCTWRCLGIEGGRRWHSYAERSASWPRVGRGGSRPAGRPCYAPGGACLHSCG